MVNIPKKWDNVNPFHRVSNFSLSYCSNRRNWVTTTTVILSEAAQSVRRSRRIRFFLRYFWGRRILRLATLAQDDMVGGDRKINPNWWTMGVVCVTLREWTATQQSTGLLQFIVRVPFSRQKNSSCKAGAVLLWKRYYKWIQCTILLWYAQPGFACFS